MRAAITSMRTLDDAAAIRQLLDAGWRLTLDDAWIPAADVARHVSPKEPVLFGFTGAIFFGSYELSGGEVRWDGFGTLYDDEWSSEQVTHFRRLPIGPGETSGAKSHALAAAATPAAAWRTAGDPDPHGARYDRERATLPMGECTDDELAGMLGLNPGPTEVIAARDRLRWLSRALVRLVDAQDLASDPVRGWLVSYGDNTATAHFIRTKSMLEKLDAHGMAYSAEALFARPGSAEGRRNSFDGRDAPAAYAIAEEILERMEDGYPRMWGSLSGAAFKSMRLDIRNTVVGAVSRTLKGRI